MSLRGILSSKGSAVTFTNPPTAAGYTSSTDTMVEPAPVTVSGYALKVAGPEEWKQGTNIGIARARVEFISTTSALPAQGATCSFDGHDWAIANIESLVMRGMPAVAFIDLLR